MGKVFFNRIPGYHLTIAGHVDQGTLPRFRPLDGYNVFEELARDIREVEWLMFSTVTVHLYGGFPDLRPFETPSISRAVNESFERFPRIVIDDSNLGTPMDSGRYLRTDTEDLSVLRPGIGFDLEAEETCTPDIQGSRVLSKSLDRRSPNRFHKSA